MPAPYKLDKLIKSNKNYLLNNKQIEEQEFLFINNNQMPNNSYIIFLINFQ